MLPTRRHIPNLQGYLRKAYEDAYPHYLKNMWRRYRSLSEKEIEAHAKLHTVSQVFFYMHKALSFHRIHGLGDMSSQERMGHKERLTGILLGAYIERSTAEGMASQIMLGDDALSHKIALVR